MICVHMTQKDECLHCLRGELEAVREALDALRAWAERQPCLCEIDGESTCSKCVVLAGGRA